MSEQNPYEKLGLTEDASFEEIQEAKKRLTQEHNGDRKLLEGIEAAYDAILMDRLKMRQEGKIPVPERIRYPEKLSQPPPSFTAVPVSRTPGWLQRLLDSPTRSDIIWTSGVYLFLSALIALSTPTSASTLPIALAFGVGFNFYFLNRKERKFGRSVLLTLAGLFAGIGLGTLLVAGLPTLIANIGFMPDKVLTLVTFIILWVIATFIR
ncbi:MAG: CPP1-like family protein [Aphanothece sp. CMT-3BRIN-NPC111]|jgi:hypothetical protein|nr:CPP1-like family protein [Aphanothece sp. CMT-3BRIN-NPC111]